MSLQCIITSMRVGNNASMNFNAIGIIIFENSKMYILFIILFIIFSNSHYITLD